MSVVIRISEEGSGQWGNGSIRKGIGREATVR